MRRVTIRDVAAEAGVSIGTASKALNGQGKLRAETRERVAEVAQRLGFAPNTLAQALLAGRSFTVGLITTDSFGRFSIPVVYAMTQPLGQDGPAVLPDDEGGGRAAAQHLLGAGRRRIGHITGPERFLAARKRAEGFGAALAAAGLRSRGGTRFGEWSEQWGREAAGKLLADQPDADAIFCGSDQIARGVADTL